MVIDPKDSQPLPSRDDLKPRSPLPLDGATLDTAESPSMEEIATTEEIIAAIECLSEVQLYKMDRFARYRVRGLGRKSAGRDHEDLIREAMTASLTGVRRWKKAKVDFFGHLVAVMRSISSHWGESFTADEPYLESELSRDESAPTVIADRACETPDAERRLAAKEELRRIEERFSDDPTVPLILSGFEQGLSAAEIQMANGISKNDYESALKRLRRWATASEREETGL
jgi:DNA-directed RNA polymerase specialized sigma24 family protein